MSKKIPEFKYVNWWLVEFGAFYFSFFPGNFPVTSSISRYPPFINFALFDHLNDIQNLLLLRQSLLHLEKNFASHNYEDLSCIRQIK